MKKKRVMAVVLVCAIMCSTACDQKTQQKTTASTTKVAITTEATTASVVNLSDYKRDKLIEESLPEVLDAHMKKYDSYTDFSGKITRVSVSNFSESSNFSGKLRGDVYGYFYWAGSRGFEKSRKFRVGVAISCDEYGCYTCDFGRVTSEST